MRQHSQSAGGHKIAGILVAMVMLGASLAPQLFAQSQTPVEEYQVKAAFLFHFAQLVAWPPDTLNPNDHSIFVCTYGDDPFHGQLEAFEGKPVQSRIFRVRHLKERQDVSDCQIVFFGHNEGSHLSPLLTQLKTAPVLTVGEGDKFVQQGGIIGFCWEGKKIRFEISAEAAERARLRVSSQLLMLAKRVVGSAHPGRSLVAFH